MVKPTSALVAVIASISMFLAMPPLAKAGFQWVSPESLSSVPSLSGASSSAPVMSGRDGMGDPLVVQADILPAASSAARAAAADDSIVLGFAKDVPLGVALKQILPEGYSYNSGSDVDLGVFVSFEGGRSWRSTLGGMLDSVGLTMNEADKKILIQRAGSGGKASSSPVPLASREGFLTLPPSAVERVGGMGMSASGRDSGGAVSVLSLRDQKVDMLSPQDALVWQAERGDSLRSVLTLWSRRVGVELQWLAEYDYPLFASINYKGSYEQAVRNILQGFEQAHPQPVGNLHMNPELGQMVLVVRVRGNSTTN